MTVPHGASIARGERGRLPRRFSSRRLLQRADELGDCIAPAIDVRPLALADAVL
jgi:hypothetical protein